MASSCQHLPLFAWDFLWLLEPALPTHVGRPEMPGSSCCCWRLGVCGGIPPLPCPSGMNSGPSPPQQHQAPHAYSGNMPGYTLFIASFPSWAGFPTPLLVSPRIAKSTICTRVLALASAFWGNSHKTHKTVTYYNSLPTVYSDHFPTPEERNSY